MKLITGSTTPPIPVCSRCRRVCCGPTDQGLESGEEKKREPDTAEPHYLGNLTLNLDVRSRRSLPPLFPVRWSTLFLGSSLPEGLPAANHRSCSCAAQSPLGKNWLSARWKQLSCNSAAATPSKSKVCSLSPTQRPPSRSLVAVIFSHDGTGLLMVLDDDRDTEVNRLHGSTANETVRGGTAESFDSHAMLTGLHVFCTLHVRAVRLQESACPALPKKIRRCT